MKKQIVRAAGAVLVVVVVLGVVKFLQIRAEIAKHESFGMPPVAVTTTVVRSVTWSSSFDTVGSFVAVRGSTLSTQDAGNVAKVSFDSGAAVAQGQVLLELDTSMEEAKLRGAKARLDLAKQHLARAQMLKTQSALSVATLEGAESQLNQAEADLQSIQAAIDRKRIVAPFAGRAGIRTVNEGEFVMAGSPLVPLYSVDPIYFNFSVPQQVAPGLAPGSKVAITIDAFPGRTFAGQVTAINPQINEELRALDVQATIPNSAGELLPGMFGRVELSLGQESSVHAVPSTAISFEPYGNSVYIVETKPAASGGTIKQVRQQLVELGQRKGDLVVVTRGLNDGDEVVTSGAFKLRPEASVVIQNSTLPGSAENPAVEDT